MPLRIFQRPDLPYDNESKHNDQRYGLLSARSKPPTSEMLDADLDYIIDSMDILSQDIQAVQAGVIVGSDDPNNANKLLTTDGANTGWTFIGSDNILNGAISTAKIAANAIITALLGDASVTETKIAAGAITNVKLANDSINNIKVQNQTITLPKLRSSGQKCLLMGTTGSNSYTEKVADNNAQPWYVFCNNPNAPTISLNSLVDIWQNTPFTFTGTQLTNSTVSGTKLINGSVLGDKLTDASVSGTKLIDVSVSGAKLTDSTVSGVKLIDGTLSGTKLIDNSVTIAKINGIANIRDIKPFATATVQANGTLSRGTNVASVTKLGTGNYRVNFTAPPTTASTNYNVQVSVGSQIFCSWETKTLNSVVIRTYNTVDFLDSAFDVVIWDTV